MLETINPQVVLLERFQEDHIRRQKSKGNEGQLLLLQTSLMHQLSCGQLCPSPAPCRLRNRLGDGKQTNHLGVNLSQCEK